MKAAGKRSRTPRIRYVIGFTLLIILLFAAVVVHQATESYKQALKQGEQTAVRLSRILADHVELTFLGVDLALRRAIERQYFNTLFGNNLPEYTEQNFKIWLNETPQIIAMAMIDEQGVVQVAAHKRGYDNWLDYHETMQGKQLFMHLREADDTQVFIGKHFTKDNDSLIIMSRRYNKVNGEFGGIVVAAMNPGYFIDFYSSIASGQQKFMALLLPDGASLAVGPYDSPAYEELSRRWLAANPEMGEQVQSLTEQMDELKITALKQLKNMPIMVSVVLDSEQVLSGWREASIQDLGFLGMFIAFGSIFSFLAIAMARQIFRVEESEASAILASQAKSEFLANMSHELRTPLNAIIGFSEMINSGYFGPLNAKQKERVHDINLCGSHLLQLITDILEFSKGDAGKLELVEEKVDIADIMSEGVRIMNGKIKTKNIHLVLAVEPDLPHVWGDKRKIRQILINLLANAVKFTPEDGTITLSGRLDQQHNLSFTVADTGIGIAEADIPKALSVFGQVHRNKSHEGTGLGLPLCKMYTELHSGKLQLTSKVGEGTSVKVTFPHQRVLLNKSAH